MGGTGVITPGNLQATSGAAVTVSPTATTTYTLTVTPSSGTAVTADRDDHGESRADDYQLRGESDNDRRRRKLAA